MKKKDVYAGIDPQKGKSLERNLRPLVGREVGVRGRIVKQIVKRNKNDKSYLRITLSPATVGGVEVDHINIFFYSPAAYVCRELYGSDFYCKAKVSKYTKRNKQTNTLYDCYGVHQVSYKYLNRYLQKVEIFDNKEKAHKKQSKKKILTPKLIFKKIEKSLAKHLCKNTHVIALNPVEVEKIQEILPRHKDKKVKGGGLEVSSKHHNFSMADLLKDVKIED